MESFKMGRPVKNDIFGTSIPVYDSYGELVAIVNGENDFYARLFTASPYLLRVCKEVRKYFGRPPLSSPACWEEEISLMVDEAIKKYEEGEKIDDPCN